MRIKIFFIFFIAILIPTSCLSYFGLLAVRSEQSIVEKSLKQKYIAIADIVEGEATSALGKMPSDKLNNISDLEKVLSEQTKLFKDEVEIFTNSGKAVSSNLNRSLKKAAYIKGIKGLPYYVIAVYENHPILFKRLERKNDSLYLYIFIIILSALSILIGGGYTFYSLSREWRFAQLKSEFVSHLSHDLRKPLTSIRMFSEMLREDKVPSEERKKHYFKIISNESDKLTHLANNILDFARIEKGRIKYNFTKNDIGKVVDEVIERFKTYMQENPREIIVTQQENIPEFKFDVNAVSQAIMNLLANADKYSPERKEIKINIIKHLKEVVVEIIDKGQGIPKKEQKKIFEKFYRVSRKDLSGPEGSGLGLTLVKYTAEAHKGRVKVESEEGEGTKFSLVLPL